MATIKLRSQRYPQYTDLKLLISHVMENGRNRDADGQLITAHFIQQLQISCNGEPVISLDMAGSIARNPFFTLRLKTTRPGDVITVSWQDNQLQHDSLEHIIQ